MSEVNVEEFIKVRNELAKQINDPVSQLMDLKNAEIEQNGYAIRNTKLPRKLKKKLKKNRQMPVLTIFQQLNV